MAYFAARGRPRRHHWVPLDPVTASTGAVRYVAGSHLDRTKFRPNTFVTDVSFGDDDDAVDVPDYDDASVLGSLPASRGSSASTPQPGDVVVHHALHDPRRGRRNASATTRRRAISVRYAGDGTTYQPAPGPAKAHHEGMVAGAAARPGGVSPRLARRPAGQCAGVVVSGDALAARRLPRPPGSQADHHTGVDRPSRVRPLLVRRARPPGSPPRGDGVRSLPEPRRHRRAPVDLGGRRAALVPRVARGADRPDRPHRRAVPPRHRAPDARAARHRRRQRHRHHRGSHVARPHRRARRGPHGDDRRAARHRRHAALHPVRYVGGHRHRGRRHHHAAARRDHRRARPLVGHPARRRARARPTREHGRRQRVVLGAVSLRRRLPRHRLLPEARRPDLAPRRPHRPGARPGAAHDRRLAPRRGAPRPARPALRLRAGQPLHPPRGVRRARRRRFASTCSSSTRCAASTWWASATRAPSGATAAGTASSRRAATTGTSPTSTRSTRSTSTCTTSCGPASTTTRGTREGVGLFEQILYGPHSQFGFSELLDGAPS